MQADFFSQQNSEVQLLPAGSERPNKRVFLYDGQVFDDPGPEYGIKEVLEALAGTYPELANGTWTSRVLPDGAEEITFVKVTGEKGSLGAAQLAGCLKQLEPVPLAAVELSGHIVEEEGRLTAGALLEMAPDIEAALGQMERLAENSRRILRQCLALKPVPHPKVPLGF